MPPARISSPHSPIPYTASAHEQKAYVDLLVRVNPGDLPGKVLSHLQPGLVHRHAIHGGVGPCEVHMLKDARRQLGRHCALLRVHGAVRRTNEHRLTGRNVTWKHRRCEAV